MFDRDWALARADVLYNSAGEAGERRRTGVYEFDLGYVVWAEEPSRADPTRPPQEVGTACAVVDKESGELTLWPPLPATLIASRYRR